MGILTNYLQKREEIRLEGKMKLIGLFALVCWYVTASQIRRHGDAARWQVRCLNCHEVSPVTKSRIIAGLTEGKTKYSLDECEHCQKTVGVAIEPVEVS